MWNGKILHVAVQRLDVTRNSFKWQGNTCGTWHGDIVHIGSRKLGRSRCVLHEENFALHDYNVEY